MLCILRQQIYLGEANVFFGDSALFSISNHNSQDCNKNKLQLKLVILCREQEDGVGQVGDAQAA